MVSELQKTCLIADDTRSMRVMINNWMTRAGFLCSITENGNAAKAAIARSCPDVLITDIEMPFFNGLELVCWIRRSPNALLTSLPIVVITSLEDPELEKIVCEIGTRFVLRKPLSEHAVLAAVAEALRTGNNPSYCRPNFESPLGSLGFQSQVRRMAENAMRHDYTNDAP